MALQSQRATRAPALAVAFEEPIERKILASLVPCQVSKLMQCALCCGACLGDPEDIHPVHQIVAPRNSGHSDFLRLSQYRTNALHVPLKSLHCCLSSPRPSADCAVSDDVVTNEPPGRQGDSDAHAGVLAYWMSLQLTLHCKLQTCRAFRQHAGRPLI